MSSIVRRYSMGRLVGDEVEEPKVEMAQLAKASRDKKWSCICKRCGMQGLMRDDRYDGIWKLFEDVRVEGNRYKVHACCVTNTPEGFEDVD